MTRLLAIGVLAFALTGCAPSMCILTDHTPKPEQLPNWLQDSQPTSPAPSLVPATAGNAPNEIGVEK